MSSQNVQLLTISSNTRIPGFYGEFDLTLANRGLPGNPINICAIGQMLASGSAAANTVVNIFSETDAINYFGAGSWLHLAVKAALQANPYISLQAVGVPDAVSGGVAAVYTLTYAGTATATGVANVGVGNRTALATVTNGDTAAVIAGNVQAALAAIPGLPFTATVAGAVVTLTAKNKGTLANLVNIWATLTNGSNNITGVTVAFAQTTIGATDPSLSSALSAIFAAGHNIVLPAFVDATNLGLVSAWAANVSNAVEERSVTCFFGYTGTYANAVTLAYGINSGRMLMGWIPGAYDTPVEIGAQFGALAASSSDFTLPLNGLSGTLLQPPVAQQVSKTVQTACLWNGITPFVAGPGSTMQILRAVTTYTVNAAAIPDPSMLDLGTVRGFDYVRYSIKTNYQLAFPRAKITKSVLAKVRTNIYTTLKSLEDIGIVTDVDKNARGLVIEQDLQSATQVDARIPAAIVQGLMVFAASIQVYLGGS